MTRTTWFKGFAGFAGAALLAGCGPVASDPPPVVVEPIKLDSTKASLTANANIADHLDGIAATIKVLEGSNLLGNVFPARSTSECPPAEPGMPPPNCDTGTTTDLDLSDEVTDVKEWLAENVFAPSAVESQTDTSVTYRLKPEVMCPEQEDESGVIARDAECVQVFTEVPFRLVVTSLAEGDLDLALKVGATTPATMELYRAKVSATADLAQVKAAINAVAAVTEDDLEGFPETFVGQVKVDVTKNAVQDYTAKLSVLSAVHVANGATTSREHYDVKVAPAANALSMHLKADTQTMVSAIDFANIDVALAADLIFGKAESTLCEQNEGGEQTCTTEPAEHVDGVLALHVGGVNAAGTFAVEDDVLALTNVGLGNDTSTVKFNGTQVLALDVNAAAGRRFDVTVTDGETGTTVAVSPQLAVTLAHDLTSLATALGENDDLPAFLKGGSSSVTLDGAAAPALRFVDGTEDPDGEEGPEQGASSKLKVAAGTLTLDGSAIDPIVITAPECIVEAAGELPDDAHIFQSVVSGSCE